MATKERTSKETFDRSKWIIPGGLSRIYSLIGCDQAAYGHRIEMTKEQFDTVKPELNRSVNEIAALFNGLGNIDYLGMYNCTEVSLQSYPSEKDGKVVKRINSLMKKTCKKLNLPYIKPKPIPERSEDTLTPDGYGHLY